MLRGSYLASLRSHGDEETAEGRAGRVLRAIYYLVDRGREQGVEAGWRAPGLAGGEGRLGLE